MSTEFRATYRILSLLEQSKRFSEDVYQSLPGVMFAIDPNFKILMANEGTAQILGVRMDDILGCGLEGLFKEPAHQRKFAEQLNLILKGRNDSVQFELPVSTHDGRLLDFLWQLKKFSVGKSKKKSLINVIGHDISALRSAMRSIVHFERDLDIGQSAQALTLPVADRFESSKWKMAGHYEPATKTGGDWWSYEVRDDGSALFLLGDVSGHGVGPAIVSALIAGCYRSVISRSGSRDVHLIFAELNRLLLNLAQPIYWMTMLAVEIFPEQSELRWYSAAAPPVLFDPGDGQFQELGSASRPLGAGDLQIVQGTEKFLDDFLLFACTDGLFEIHPKVSSRSVTRNLIKLAQQERNPDHLKERIKEKIVAWRQGQAPQDDIAFFILGRGST